MTAREKRLERRRHRIRHYARILAQSLSRPAIRPLRDPEGHDYHPSHWRRWLTNCGFSNTDIGRVRKLVKQEDVCMKQ